MIVLDTIAVTLLTYCIQTFVVWMGLGIVTGFQMDCGRAGTWAATWPYQIPRWLLLRSLRFLRWLLPKLWRLIRRRAIARAIMITRLEDQHRLYLQGLMEDDEGAYAKGLYGEYPPVDWKEAS